MVQSHGRALSDAMRNLGNEMTARERPYATAPSLHPVFPPSDSQFLHSSNYQHPIDQAEIRDFWTQPAQNYQSDWAQENPSQGSHASSSQQAMLSVDHYSFPATQFEHTGTSPSRILPSQPLMFPLDNPYFTHSPNYWHPVDQADSGDFWTQHNPNYQSDWARDQSLPAFEPMGSGSRFIDSQHCFQAEPLHPH
ncbi:hypothetical protein B0H13DRAFT_1861569 [Mycena leptocephala]|nr:hypothetical protein B0H13DRAFT_1861569 [Mycena leptocephala]